MAKGNDGELVPWNADKKDVHEEVLRRNAKVGHSTKYGEPTYRTRIMETVPCGKQKLNVWPRDKNGNLIGD